MKLELAAIITFFVGIGGACLELVEQPAVTLEPFTVAVTAETTGTVTVMRQPGQQPTVSWVGVAGPVTPLMPQSLAPPAPRTATHAANGDIIVFLEHPAPTGIAWFGVYWRKVGDPNWSFSYESASSLVAIRLVGTAGAPGPFEISTRSYAGPGTPLFVDPNT